MNFEPIFLFLKNVARNNNREWFEKNKPKYLLVKQAYEDFVTAFLIELRKFEDGLDDVNPKKLPMRIYRDVRFSKDKRPYKNNLVGGFSPNGKLAQEPGYYLHIQPGDESFLAGGMYVPEPENLAKIRQEIDYSSERFLKIVEDKKFKKLFPALDDFDKLKTMPKGYPKDHPQIEYLKHKSFIVSRSFTDAEVKDKNFLKKLVETAKTIKPLNDFMKDAIA